MERVDTNTSSTDEKPSKPILLSTHSSRKSISGMDFLNGLKIITSTSTNDIPPSPIPSSAHTPVTEHHIADQIDDFDIKEPIGNIVLARIKIRSYLTLFFFFFFGRLWVICYCL